MNITDIDLKGLNIEQVQRAIDRYISDRDARIRKYKYESDRRERIARDRKIQGHRQRLVNAIKRGNVSVRTNESWRNAEVSVGTRPDEDGWFSLGLHPYYIRSINATETEKNAEDALARVVAKLLDNPEIEFDITTKLETFVDGKPRLMTAYSARLVAKKEN